MSIGSSSCINTQYIESFFYRIRVEKMVLIKKCKKYLKLTNLLNGEMGGMRNGSLPKRISLF